jgi:hypothetical protein
LFHQVCLYVQLKFKSNVLDERFKRVEWTYQGRTLCLDQVCCGNLSNRGGVSHSVHFQPLLVHIGNLFLCIEEDQRKLVIHKVCSSKRICGLCHHGLDDATFTGVLIPSGSSV